MEERMINTNWFKDKALEVISADDTVPLQVRIENALLQVYDVGFDEGYDDGQSDCDECGG
jgi:hypothetical protein